MTRRKFKVGQLIRLEPRFHDNRAYLLVRNVPLLPDGKYWQWLALCGEEMVYIQSYNEYQYEIVV